MVGELVAADEENRLRIDTDREPALLHRSSGFLRRDGTCSGVRGHPMFVDDDDEDAKRLRMDCTEP